MSDGSPTATTATTQGARDHARSMAGTVVEAMPTVPPPDGALWDEVVAGGGYSAFAVPRGARIRLVDLQGDACAGLLLHRAGGETHERLNVADTVKVQWQAYLGSGRLLLSDMGRVLASIVEDTSGRHDAFCGTSNRRTNEARYGDGAADGPCPNGRDHFGVALAKLGLSRRDIAPNVNLFKGVRVGSDGSLTFDGDPTKPRAHVELRAELPLVVSIVNVPHPVDPRPDYTVTPLRITARPGRPGSGDDATTIEAERAYRNTEQAATLHA